MKLGDLNMGDCGKQITLSLDADRQIPTTISGPLRYVNHETQWIEDRTFGQQESTYIPGRVTTEIHVGQFKAELPAYTECTLDAR